MNDSLIRKFCESRHRWPIVATATVLTALATVVPSVDDCCNKRSSRNDLVDKLVLARRNAQELPQTEAQAAQVAAELAALEARAVDEEDLARFRSRLVDVVRDSGCQIRRLDIATPLARVWKQGDKALEEQPAGDGADTPFSLERRSVVLAVDGGMAAVQDLMTRLEQEQTLSHPHRVQLQAAASGGETVTLELELWLFAFKRTSSASG
jgi:hypothetical protein